MLTDYVNMEQMKNAYTKHQKQQRPRGHRSGWQTNNVVVTETDFEFADDPSKYRTDSNRPSSYYS